jgi:hypothetical protein
MPNTNGLRRATTALLAATFIALLAPQAAAQSSRSDDRLDATLRHRSGQLSGRSRVIVQFKSDVDVRVFGKGAVTGRRLTDRAQVAELDNVSLDSLAKDPRVERVMVDRPVFATLERTGLATGATAARQQLGVTGKGEGALRHRRALQGLRARDWTRTLVVRASVR